MPRPTGSEPIADMLRDGDPRTLHGVTRAIAEVERDPSRFAELARAMTHDDVLVRMRAGDAAEKISRRHPEYLEPHRALLLSAALATDQPSLRWHLAQMLPRIALDAEQRRSAVTMLRRYLDDRSALVKTSAMQALAELALADPSLRRRVIPMVRNATLSGTAAMRARGIRLLEMLRR